MQQTVAPITDLSSLSRKVAIWAWISVGTQAALSLFSYLEAAALARMAPSEEINWLDPVLSPDTDLAAGAVSLVMFVAIVIASVISLRWIYLSNRNAHVLAEGLTVSPGWNVGWFFVPIANLYKPFEGVEQVWRASKNPEDWRAAEIPAHLRWWWAFWLLTSILGGIGWRIEISGGTVGARLLANITDIASTVFAIPATIFFLRIIREVSAFQAGRSGPV